MLRCIIADDSKIMRMLLRKILENLNFEVDEAEDGEEVVELCAQTPVDLIISDWELPLMDGIDVLYKIRADRKIRQPKFVFCSYQKDADTIRQALDGGADDFIMRPFDEDIVAAKLAILKLV